MGLQLGLLAALTLPQIVIVTFFNRRNIKNTGKNKGSNNTASAAQALLFGILTTIICPPVLYQQYSLGGANTVETDLIMHLAVSFFLAHIAFVVVSKRVSSELIHHLICLVTLLYSLVTQTFGQDLVLTIFLGEITFVLYIKIIAKNFKNIELEKLCETIFVFMLVPLRLIIFPLYLYFFVSSPNAELLPSLLALAYVLLGFHFSRVVVQKWKANGTRKVSVA
ncbi:MAG: hypothetical protein GY810_19050 [Aureispira sp.]|nr:hypothetical protein [Aureispira sp.]